MQSLNELKATNTFTVTTKILNNNNNKNNEKNNIK